MNPQVVLDTVINESTSNKKIQKLTISRYAFLEKIKSPFVTKTEFSLETVIPSIYVMVIDKGILKNYSTQNIEQLKKDAFDWADDNVGIGEISEYIDCILNEVNSTFNIVDNSKSVNSEESPKKA